MSESWVVKYRTLIQRLLYKLEEQQMRDTSGEFDFHNVKFFLSEQFKEINRLEGMCKLKDQEYDKLKKEYDTLYNKIFQPDAEPESETPQAQDGTVEEEETKEVPINPKPEKVKPKHPWGRK